MCRTAVAGNFQEAHAAQDGKNLARSAFGIVGAETSGLRLRSNRDLERGGRGAKNLRRIVWSDVGDEIAKAVDLQHHTSQRMLVHRLGARRAKADIVRNLVAKTIRLHSLGEVGRDRREDVARMKRVAAWLQKIMFSGDVAHGDAFFAIVYQRKHPVVGSHKQMALTGENDGPPRGSDSGVDDHHVHSAGREVGIGLGNRERAIENVEGLHRVADIDQLRLGSDLEDYSFHRADKMIVESKIRSKRNNWNAWQIGTS